MIQRIQSVYLLLASLAAFALFLLAFANVSGDTVSVAALSDGDFDIQDNIILLILTIVCGAMAILNIFLFNNRKLQMRVGLLLVILNLALAIAAAFLTYQATNAEGISTAYSFGLAMPLVAIIFAYLANRSIQKDEKLVSSAYNRLR